MTDLYRTVIADPPWDYQQWTDTKHGAVASQYPTMNLEGILALGDWVKSVTAPESVLLLWATWPKLKEALSVVEAWGFSYVTGFPWIKGRSSGNQLSLFKQDIDLSVQRGIGFWTMGVSEMVLCASRNGASAGRTRQLGLLCGSERQFYAPRGAHSRKPVDLHCYAEQHLEAPRLELFARRKREGWTTLGLDLGVLLTPSGPCPVGPTE